MKCYASPLDVCHNIIKCEPLGKCFYEKELMNFPIITNDKTALDTIWFVRDRKIVRKIEGINMDNFKDKCQDPNGCQMNCTHWCLFLDNRTANELNINKQTDEPIHHFESGASSSGHKPPYECLTPTLLKRAAMRMQKGLHYGKHNWKKGAKDKQFILDRLNHALEHLIKAQSEIDSDVVMTDDDLAAVVVNCMFAMEYQNAMTARQNQTNQREVMPGSILSAMESKHPSQIVIDPAFEHDLRKILNKYTIDAKMKISDTALASLLVTYLYKIKG